MMLSCIGANSSPALPPAGSLGSGRFILGIFSCVRMARTPGAACARLKSNALTRPLLIAAFDQAGMRHIFQRMLGGIARGSRHFQPPVYAVDRLSYISKSHEFVSDSRQSSHNRLCKVNS